MSRLVKHRCDNCGLVATWDKGWGWYGSYLDLEEIPDQAGIVKFCSDKCKQELELLDGIDSVLAKKQEGLKRYKWR